MLKSKKLPLPQITNDRVKSKLNQNTSCRKTYSELLRVFKRNSKLHTVANQTQQNLASAYCSHSSVTTLPLSAHHQPSSVSVNSLISFALSMHMPETIFPHFFPQIITFIFFRFQLDCHFYCKAFPFLDLLPN